MRRCMACTHPKRAAIDAELLQGVPLRTVAGRYGGVSYSALQRHRSQHVEAPTVGDIQGPAGAGDGWREWDGSDWQRIDAPRREHLVEVQGRPVNVPWRTGLNLSGAHLFPFLRKVYRRKSG